MSLFCPNACQRPEWQSAPHFGSLFRRAAKTYGSKPVAPSSRRTYARAAGSPGEKAEAFDAILTLPARCLVRKRGGVKKTTRRLNTSLRFIAAAAHEAARSGIPLPAAPGQQGGRHSPKSEGAWERKMRTATQLAKRKHYRKGLQHIVGLGIAEMTPEVIEVLERCFTHDSSPIPRRPAHSPPVLVDEEALHGLIRAGANGSKGGPSGWSCEQMLPLLRDGVCSDGLKALIEDIANFELDPGSCHLLRATLMAAANKKTPGKKRTLMMGEVFAKLAGQYAKALDKDQFPGIFGKIQVLVGSRGGPELALQSTQAAQESDASHVTLHLDVTDAYPSVDRGLMLQSIYGDPRLQHLWRSFDFAFSEPAVILVRSGEEVIHTAVSDNGVPQGNILSSLAYARVVQPVYEASIAGLDVTAKAAMDDFTATGSVPDILEVYDRLEEGLAALSCSVSLLKTKIQVTNGVPSEDLLLGASQRGITVVCGNVEALGAMVGLDDEEYEVFLEEELSSYDALFRAIRSPTLPAALALYYGRICVLPKPVYLMRNLPLRITLGQMGSFDTRLREAVLSRLPTSLIRQSSPFISRQDRVVWVMWRLRPRRRRRGGRAWLWAQRRCRS